MTISIRARSTSYPHNLTNLNGTLAFSANDATHGYEVWKSDGTTEGTVLVDDINSGISGSAAYRLTNVSGTLFFTANDGIHGYASSGKATARSREPFWSRISTREVRHRTRVI